MWCVRVCVCVDAVISSSACTAEVNVYEMIQFSGVQVVWGFVSSA